MKKLLLTLSALTLCMVTCMEAGFFSRNNGDCNSCNTTCRKERATCAKPCKPACEVKECLTCPKPCKRTEQKIEEIVVPCPRIVEIMEYKILPVPLTREVCEPVEATVGKWRCCDPDGKKCGQCDACHNANVIKNERTGVLSNDPLYLKAENDPDLAAKLEKVDRDNTKRGWTTGETEATGFEAYEAQQAAQEKTNKKPVKAKAKKAKKARTAKANDEEVEMNA